MSYACHRFWCIDTRSMSTKQSYIESSMSVGESIDACHECGAPATRTLCAYAYCDGCADDLLAPLRHRWGMPHIDGKAPNHGDGWYWLRCQCEARWVGRRSDECAWCAIRIERTVSDQRQHLLYPQALATPQAVAVWRERIAHAVRSEIVSNAEAMQAQARLRR